MITTLSYALYFALLTVWLFALPAWKVLTSPLPDAPNGYDALGKEIEIFRAVDLFTRKPFTCIYCMAFWVGLIGSAFIHLSQGASLSFAVVLPAPVASILAVAIDKAIKALPTKF